MHVSSHKEMSAELKDQKIGDHELFCTEIYEMFGSKTAMIAEKLLFGVRKSRKKESARRLMITRGKEKEPSRRERGGREEEEEEER